MRFEQALEAMRQGKRVARPEWGSSSIFVTGGEMRYGRLGEQHSMLCDEVLAVHLMADDWLVVVEPRTLADVLPAFREGKAIRRRSWHDTSPSLTVDNTEFLALVFSNILADDWEVVD